MTQFTGITKAQSVWLGLANGNSQIIRMISDLCLGETHTGNHASHNSGADPFSVYGVQQPKWKLNLALIRQLGEPTQMQTLQMDFTRQECCCKAQGSTLTKCWDKNRHCLCLRWTLQDDLFLSLLFSCLLPCPSKSGLCTFSLAISTTRQPWPSSPICLSSCCAEKSSKWVIVEKSQVLPHTHTLALTTLEARHPQAVYDLNSDLPCVRETTQLYRPSLPLNEATLLCN